MKATGIVRKIDDLGRIVLPAELRRILELDDRAEVEIYTQNDTVILKKYKPSCVFCGSQNQLSEYRGYNICSACREALGTQPAEAKAE